eukprot:1481652-Rhodomonas_salina.1
MLELCWLLAGLLCCVVLVIRFRVWKRVQQARGYGSGLEVIEGVCIGWYEFADWFVRDRHSEDVISDAGGAGGTMQSTCWSCCSIGKSVSSNVTLRDTKT